MFKMLTSPGPQNDIVGLSEGVIYQKSLCGIIVCASH